MASGAYIYLKSSLSSQAKEEIKVPRGAVKIVFDNEQVIGKRYTVKSSRNAVPRSVMTNHVYISIDVGNSMQCLSELKPCHWIFSQFTDMLLTNLLDFPNFHSTYFRKSLNRFMQTRIEFIFRHQSK